MGQDMSRDLSGKLLCGAAVPVQRDGEADSKRAVALAEAGANVLYLFGDGVDAQLELCLGKFSNGWTRMIDKMWDECEGTNWVARILRGGLFLNDTTSLTIPKTWHHAASLWTWWGYCKWVQIRLTSTVDFNNWNQTLTTSLSCMFVCFLIVCDPFFLRIYFLIFFEI